MTERKNRRFVTGTNGAPVTTQHTKPCADCPWSRKAIRGWLNGMPAGAWTEAAHGETKIPCHVLQGAQCAGSAIFRANVCKVPRDPNQLVLPVDMKRVFASTDEFRDHHTFNGRGRP